MPALTFTDDFLLFDRYYAPYRKMGVVRRNAQGLDMDVAVLII